jgi:hypothetical protein
LSNYSLLLYEFFHPSQYFSFVFNFNFWSDYLKKDVLIGHTSVCLFACVQIWIMSKYCLSENSWQNLEAGSNVSNIMNQLFSLKKSEKLMFWVANPKGDFWSYLKLCSFCFKFTDNMSTIIYRGPNQKICSNYTFRRWSFLISSFDFGSLDLNFECAWW